MECLDALGFLLAEVVLPAFALASLFRFGSRPGAWLSNLATENHNLWWAACGLATWTVTLA